MVLGYMKSKLWTVIQGHLSSNPKGVTFSYVPHKIVTAKADDTCILTIKSEKWKVVIGSAVLR